MFRKPSLLVVLILGSVCLWTSSAWAQDETDPCAAPVVLTKNCRFQRPMGSVTSFGVLYHDWNPFVISGSPAFDANYHGNSYDPDDLVNGGREQSIYSTNNQPWRGGIWQQINNVVPGNGYFARVGWFVSQNTSIVGRVGIDPNGGTDPNSAAIVWGQPLNLLRQTRINVRGVRAASTRITVFVEATSNNPFPGGDRLWLTAVSVSPDPSLPTATATAIAPAAAPTSTPTNTRIPPTRTPTRVPPTHTPAPTDTPTFTPTPTETATFSPPPTETASPTATATRRATATPTPEPLMALSTGANLMGVDVIGLGLLGASSCSFVLAMGLGGFAYWFWRRRSNVRTFER